MMKNDRHDQLMEEFRRVHRKMFTSHASNDDDDDVGVNNDAKNVVSKPIMDSYVREEAKAEVVKKVPKFLAASNDTEDVTAIVSVDVKVATPPGNNLLLFSIFQYFAVHVAKRRR